MEANAMSWLYMLGSSSVCIGIILGEWKREWKLHKGDIGTHWVNIRVLLGLRCLGV